MDQLESHPAAFGAIVAWLAAPGIFAISVQAVNRGYFKTRYDGIVRADDNPRLFQIYRFACLALGWIVVAGAIALTALACHHR